jgi:hypothetical protein
MRRHRHDRDKDKHRFYLLPGQGGRALKCLRPQSAA